MSAMSTQRNRMEVYAVFAGALLVATIWALTPRSRAFASEAIEIEIPTVSGLPGDSVDMSVVLHTNGNDVAGIQIDVEAAAPLTLPIADSGRPDCWRNEALTKDYTVYSFPSRFEGQWNRMRALVLSLTNIDSIPDGSLLFTCRVEIDADAEPGEYQLLPMRLAGSTPEGVEIPAVASGGTVLVADADEDTVPLSAASNQASGGCAIQPGVSNDAAWMLLALPALLVWRRMRD